MLRRPAERRRAGGDGNRLASGLSPGSTLPPGNSHSPASCLPGGRCASSTRPCPSSSATATTRTSGLASLPAAAAAAGPAGAAGAAAPGADAMGCRRHLLRAARGALAAALLRPLLQGGAASGGRRQGAERQRWARAPASQDARRVVSGREVRQGRARSTQGGEAGGGGGGARRQPAGLACAAVHLPGSA